MAHTTTITKQTRDWAGVMTVDEVAVDGWHAVTVPDGGIVGEINRKDDRELIAALVAYQTVTAA